MMIKLHPDGWYESSRGPVATFSKDNQPEGVEHPQDLIGNTVFIGRTDRPYKVKGVEHWAIICPRPGGDGTCGHPFGLLLEYQPDFAGTRHS